MRWLVTGGAGYIGSHVLRGLLAAGHDAVAFDNLSRGYRSRIGTTVPFIDGDIRDSAALMDALIGVDGVIHLAGVKSVSESQREPLLYWDVNTAGTLELLRAMRYRDVGLLVFSSTASVYGDGGDRISEDASLSPQSVYGATKLAAEQMIADYAERYGMRHAVLRYFNVAGCGFPGLNDTSRDNVIPAFLHALRNGFAPTIYGDDYPTRDGTCVRDYVHVADIASAHVAVATALPNGLRHSVYNIGTGDGVSVRELAALTAATAGVNVEPMIAARRDGDPAETVADVTRIRRELGWSARLGIRDIVESAFHFAAPISS